MKAITLTTSLILSMLSTSVFAKSAENKTPDNPVELIVCSKSESNGTDNKSESNGTDNKSESNGTDNKNYCRIITVRK